MKIVRLIKKSLVILCTVLLFFSIISVMLLTATKNIVSKESISDYINKANILELQVGKVLKTDNTSLDNNSTIRETILAMAKNASIPEAIIDDVIKSNELSNLLGDFVKGIIDYAVIGVEKPTISDEAKEQLINTANKSLESHIDLVMEEEELDKYIENFINTLNGMVPERNDIVIDSSKLDLVRNILTFDTTYLYVSILILTSLIVVLLRNWYYPIKSLGITMLISGVLFTIVGCLEWPIYNLIKDSIVKIDDLIHPLLNKVLMICFKEGVIYSALGIVLIILFVVIHRFIDNRKRLDETKRINIEQINI